MTIVKIAGYSSNEGTREFEILEREKLEELINNLSPFEIYKDTFQKADNYMHSGIAYTYIDARTGMINICWLQSNNFNHPWDSFYEIWLCDLKSGDQKIDLNTPDNILAIGEEFEKWREFNGTLEEMLGEEEYQERYENAIDGEAIEFSFDWENITEQLNELY
jgi:hypothetical protein